MSSQEKYDHKSIESKWLPRWEKQQLGKVANDDKREKKYVVDMFSYPSGDLHMGHAEAYVMADVWARYLTQQGYAVVHPIGWDSFGLPAENAAIKHDEHPATWTYKNIDTQAESFKHYGILVDWSRRLHTSDPEYYKWTQWIFNQFYKKGLAYRKKSPVNWCPKDQTVLANEQVVGGACERCGTPVTKKNLNQWYFKITEYAEELLDDMKELEGHWPDRVLSMQRNWIGRSEGATIKFTIEEDEDKEPKDIEVYTTRPDTLFGVTFFAVAVDSELAAEIVTEGQKKDYEEYLEKTKALSDIERQSTEREKTGVFSGRYIKHPFTAEKMPVWITDYVLADYGTGAIMAVPAHDQRDLDFATKFDLPVRVVVDGGEEDPAKTKVATADDGTLVNSEFLNGLNKLDAIAKAIEKLEERGLGKRTTNYRLRDWLISRQRFWGAPIPIVHCEKCGEVPVPDEQLPVKLPDDVKGEQLAPKGISPLASMGDWANVDCPECGGKAHLDGDTMDTFVDSSWYYLRYINPNMADKPFDSNEVNHWLPVDHYVGGVEHAILHLLYSRFVTKVLRDLGHLNFDEPFKNLLNQGQVLNQGKAMSKSLGNGVDLGEQLNNYGVDAVRLSMIFAGPPEDDIDWADVSPNSSVKFLGRAWRLGDDVKSEAGVDASKGDKKLRAVTHKTLKEAAEAIEQQKFNIIVARVMELVNHTRKAIDSGCGGEDPAAREATEVVATVLSLVAPYTAEDLWEKLGHKESVVHASWTEVDEDLLVQETLTAVVQVNGKLRHKMEVPANITAEELEKQALEAESVQRAIGDKPIRKVINRAPKLISVVAN
ncbi:MAG: leucine--tRNA ligase [Micrococcaceae bacterium]